MFKNVAWALALPLSICSIPCNGQTTSVWVHGSYVNVRQAARNDAAVVAQFPTNTPLKLVQRKGDWCEVEQGFILCRLIGDKPLTLADTNNAQTPEAARRAFWIAPSWSRLVAAGEALTQTLLSSQQRETEITTERANRWKVPEFEAVKERLRAGVAPKIEDEISSTIQTIPPDFLSSLQLPKEALPAIKPSLFRKRTEFALSPSASIDQAAALHNSTLKMLRVLSAPRFRNTGSFDDRRFEGAWDIGKVELGINPPIIAYHLGNNGMLAASSISTAIIGIEGPNECYTKHYEAWDAGPKKNLPGYPRLKPTQEILQFFTVHPLRPDPVQITTREFRVSVNTRGNNGERSVEKTVVRVIDLNQDKIPDLLIINGIINGVVVDFIHVQYVLVNIGGIWSLEGIIKDIDCT